MKPVIKLGKYLLLLAAFALPMLVQSQTWPTRPIRLVVPLSAGGGTDQIARMLALRLSDSLGQQVFIDNRPGAGGNIGSDHVAKSPADGYTLLVGTSATHATNVSLYGSKMPYDAVKDFTPISLIGYTPLILMAHPSLNVDLVKDLIARARANPGAINYGSSGNGTASQLGMEYIKRQADINIVHVPYKGAGQATQDLLAGHVSVQFDSVPAALPLVRSGKLKALGVTSLKRLAIAPEIPPIADTLPGFEYTAWIGILGPANMPPSVTKRLNTELVRILGLPDVRSQLAASGFDAAPTSPEDFSSLIKADIVKLGKIVAASGAKLD